MRNGAAIAGVLAAVLCCAAANGEMQFDEGRWRLELSGWGATDTGGGSDGWLTTGTVDYEFPATPHLTLGLRMMPLLVYGQDDVDGDWDCLCRDDHGGDTVWGAGAGLTLRLYQVPGEYRGLFGEIQTNVLAHDGHFNGNGSNVNFLSAIGIGYQFRNDWHATLKFGHISNAGLDDDNSGTNVLGLGIGYRF